MNWNNSLPGASFRHFTIRVISPGIDTSCFDWGHYANWQSVDFTLFENYTRCLCFDLQRVFNHKIENSGEFEIEINEAWYRRGIFQRLSFVYTLRPAHNCIVNWYKFALGFRWSLFPIVQLTMFQDCFNGLSPAWCQSITWTNGS